MAKKLFVYIQFQMPAGKTITLRLEKKQDPPTFGPVKAIKYRHFYLKEDIDGELANKFAKKHLINPSQWKKW